MNVIDLWLPILLAGLATHIASTLAWTVLPHHKPEMKGLGAEKEEELQDWVADSGLPAGSYLFPFPEDMKECNSDAFKSKQGKCLGELVLWDQPVNMGAAIGKTLAFFFVAAFTIGYLASIALPVGADKLLVFRFVTTAGLLAHCFAKFPHVFWFPTKVAMSLVDGAAYRADNRRHLRPALARRCGVSFCNAPRRGPQTKKPAALSASVRRRLAEA